ncbi:MAG TPA: hypothetical protein PLK24_09525 [Atribacter sp.]|uniref:hypothetical protein n=1 Tax=Atribacter sp. TaxID=2847780 RepID=UPI002C81A5CE|nr:hypothetical protein [Atribacter sp.]HQK84165.1 hypothetical protein [Atribacter sp.]
MPGNEKDVARFLVLNKGRISLDQIGSVMAVGAPGQAEGSYVEIPTERDVDILLAAEDSRKKADIYINGKGVSVKQAGASFSYNRLQRANILEVFRILGFDNPEALLHNLDKEVRNFHAGNLPRRNRPWRNFFSEQDFKTLVKFLMVQGSPNVGFSAHQAEFIIEAPSHGIAAENIKVYTFDEYFDQYKDSLMIAIRRQWIGQESDSEHNRAVGLAGKAANAPWVFNNVVGVPRNGWRQGFPAQDRKTVYFLMIEKTA